MTTSKVLIQHSPLNQKQQNHLPRCRLNWRQGQLFVSLEQQLCQHLPALENEQWLVVPRHSPVRLLRIDPALVSNDVLGRCEQANKAVFLRLPAGHKLLRNRRLRNGG